MELPRLKLSTSNYIKSRYTHVLLLGKSGTGKSSLISNWWQQDCFYKNAMVLIEPSGFLAKDCYSLARGNAHYCSLETPVSINPMQAPYNPNQISDNIAESLNQVIKLTTSNQELTVKMRAILDDAIKYCLERNRKSLVNVLDYIENQKGNAETRDGLIQRLKFLLNDERMIPILCGNDTVNWGKLVINRERFIFDSFGMGREKMIFAGNLISQAIKNYFRYERPKEYRPLAVYIDECHNFINYNFMDILKEGRKFNLSVVMATQDLAFDDRLARIMLNVGNIVTFRVGAREAHLIANELGKIKEDEVIYKTEIRGNKVIDVVDKVTVNKNDTKTLIQFLDKHHLAFMTPEKVGTGKAPRPPFIKKVEPKRPEPKREPEGDWFILESYHAA